MKALLYTDHMCYENELYSWFKSAGLTFFDVIDWS